MHSRRGVGGHADQVRADAAARRLAQIAADLGADLGAPADGVAVVEDNGDTVDVAPWWSDHTRVKASADDPAQRPTQPAVPASRSSTGSGALPAAPLPQPGRHAARRRGLPAPARLVGAVRDRLPGLGPAHLAVVALAVALGLAVTTWWVVRDDPSPGAVGAPVAGEPLEPLAAAGSGSPAGSASPAGTVTVDVAGKVKRPGIVVLDHGARVTDALEAAGGARKGVDLTSLNLARVLVDGEQIVVGGPAPVAGAAGRTTPAPGGAAAGAGGLVNLNLASQAELEALPQVGPVTAQSIIAWREQRGGFTSVDELLEVDGIGEKTLERLAPYVTV